MSTRTAAMLLGGVLLLGAALGFVPALLVPNADIHPLSVDTPHDQLFGLFPVNAADNILHALLGLWGLAWSRGSRTAARYLRIMTGILQALVNILAFEMTAVEAVSAPRFDCQSDTLDAEARIPSWVKEAAAERAGLKLWPNPAPYGNFALVQAAIINHETGLVSGGADPRSGGAVMPG